MQLAFLKTLKRLTAHCSDIVLKQPCNLQPTSMCAAYPYHRSSNYRKHSLQCNRLCPPCHFDQLLEPYCHLYHKNETQPQLNSNETFVFKFTSHVCNFPLSSIKTFEPRIWDISVDPAHYWSTLSWNDTYTKNYSYLTLPSPPQTRNSMSRANKLDQNNIRQ